MIFCKTYILNKLDKIFKLERKIINTFELDTLTELNTKQNFTTTIIACPFSVQAHAENTVSLLLVGLPEMQSWWWWWKTWIVEHLWSAKSGYSLVGGLSRSRKFFNGFTARWKTAFGLVVFFKFDAEIISVNKNLDEKKISVKKNLRIISE